MQSIPETSPRFSNLQLELLRLYSADIPDADLLEIKRLIANFYAERAIAAADAVWEASGWTDEDADRMLNTKMRASKK